MNHASADDTQQSPVSRPSSVPPELGPPIDRPIAARLLGMREFDLGGFIAEEPPTLRDVTGPRDRGRRA